MSVNDFFSRFKRASVAAFVPAMRMAWWITKLMLPITLGISILSYLGVVAWVSDQLSPLFGTIGLSGESSLIFITSALSNLYSGLAVMITMGVDYRSAVILASMTLICHNLIIETAVQKKAGTSVLQSVLLRIGASFLCGYLLNLILPAAMNGTLNGMVGTGVQQASSWSGLFMNWGKTIVPLLIKMVILIVSLNVLQSILREFKILDIIAYPLRPLMTLFGLPHSTSFLWIICNVIGITYGGAAIVYEIEHGKATLPEAQLLNTHVSVSHSLLEDTLIFFSFGLPLFWLMAPRLIMAVSAVWIQRLFRYIVASRKKISPETS